MKVWTRYLGNWKKFRSWMQRAKEKSHATFNMLYDHFFSIDGVIFPGNNSSLSPVQVILRSTIIALRHVLGAGLDLLRLECLESLDTKTRDRLLEKKYK